MDIELAIMAAIMGCMLVGLYIVFSFVCRVYERGINIVRGCMLFGFFGGVTLILTNGQEIPTNFILAGLAWVVGCIGGIVFGGLGMMVFVMDVPFPPYSESAFQEIKGAEGDANANCTS